MEVDQPEICRLMEVYAMFNICTYFVFTWWAVLKDRMLSFSLKQSLRITLKLLYLANLVASMYIHLTLNPIYRRLHVLMFKHTITQLAIGQIERILRIDFTSLT